MENYILKQLNDIKEVLESGIEFRDMQLIKKAIQAYDGLKPIALNTDHWNAVKENIIRGCTALCVFDPPNALNYLDLASKYDSNHPVILNNLGYIYHMQHSNWSQSVQSYESCLLADPTYVMAYLGIVDVYRTLRHHQLELEYCQKGVKNCPDSSEIWNSLGLAMLNTQVADLSSINECFTIALEKNPTLESKAKILINIGHLNGVSGDFTTAVSNYLDAIESDNTHQAAYQNILLNMHYFSDKDLINRDPVLARVTKMFRISKNITKIDDVIDKLHKKMVGIMYPLSTTAESTSMNMTDFSTRKVVIGYVTSDLIDHAVSYFVKCLFSHYNASTFDIYVYSNSVYDQGAINEVKCTGYRCIKGVSAQEAVKQIKKDQVDILIDLSGHTSGNRLDIFALKPAPIMLSYCGYPNNTGFPFVKRVSDVYTEKFTKNQTVVLARNPETTTKEETGVSIPLQDGSNVLTLQRLFLCYTPKVFTKEWTLLNIKSYMKFKPSEGVVTFGCFAKLQKINKYVIDLWIQILEKMPKSRLVLKSKYFRDEDVVCTWKQKFKGHADRVILLKGTKTTEEHLEMFKMLDIHLDTFPYSGTTITTESLFMNVPVLTLSIVSVASVGHVQRVSGSILNSMGYAKECVANTEDEYVEKACRLVNLLPNLPSVRKRFLTSDISAPAKFMSHYETMLLDQFLENRE